MPVRIHAASRLAGLRRVRAAQAGFTLIEVMVAAAIVALLAGIAVPAYRGYVVRGQLVPGTNALLSMRTQMEQYYQDNRTYAGSGTACGVAAPTNVANFSLSCTASSATAYTITATGSGNVSGFAYSIDQLGSQQTVSMASGWAGVALPFSGCFLIKKHQSSC